MSDIRFNRWLHQSGTGGVFQDSSGNVGVGTSVPRSALDIVGVINVTGNINSTGVTTVTTLNIGTGTSISSPATNVLTLGTNNVERARVDSSGRLGIGTNNPTGNGDQTTIHVHAADYPVLHLTNSTTGTATSDGSELTLNADGSLILRNRENSFIRFDTNGSERARVSAGGSFGINNNNPLSTLSVGTRTSDVSDTSLIFTAGGSSSGGEVLAATFCNTASGATNNSTAISFTCRAGDSQTAKIVAKQPSGASSPNTQLEFYVYGNSGSTKVVTFDQNGRVLMPYQPAFCARTVGSVSPLSGNIVLNTTILNNGNHYSTSTGNFTAPIAGMYYFSFTGFTENSSSGSADISIQKNGTPVVRTYTSEATGTYRPFAVDCIVSLAANDTVRPNSGIEIHGNLNANFSGFLIG